MRWRVIGKLLIGSAATATLIAIALPFATYGALGLHAAYTEHLLWSQAGMVYWTLMLVAAIGAVFIVLAWFLLLRSRKVHTEHKVR